MRKKIKKRKNHVVIGDEMNEIIIGVAIVLLSGFIGGLWLIFSIGWLMPRIRYYLSFGEWYKKPFKDR